MPKKIRSFYKSNVERIVTWAKKHPRGLHITSVALGVCAVLFFAYSLLLPQTITYSYSSQQACTVAPKFFPQLFTIKNDSGTFAFERKRSFAVGSVVLYSHGVCAVVAKAPASSAAVSHREQLRVLSFIQKPIRVTTPSYPRTQLPKADAAIPVTKPLVLNLSEPDAVFEYRIHIDNKSQTCVTKSNTVSCNLAPLQLKHASSYKAQLLRYFKQKNTGVVAEQTITTLTPITIADTSIKQGATVFDKPGELVIKTDKPIKTLGKVTLTANPADASAKAVPLDASIVDTSSIKITLPELARKVAHEIKIANLEATDQSGLPEDNYKLAFTTSGGPTVTTSSIGSSRVAARPNITITLDQPLGPSQDFNAVLGMYVGNARQPAVVTASGNRLTITPSQALPACTTFTLKTTADIASDHGIKGDSAWSKQSRTLCGIPFGIGTSAKGRAITGYKFGSGSNPVIYLGALHGTEPSSKTILDRWVNSLEDNPGKIPAGRSVIVIPNTNPDGIVANSRLNSRGVDLNRNFPANDWKASITVPGGQLLPAGGGSAPLSEPESAAVANYISANQPRLVLTYHAVGGLVEANEAGNSLTRSSRYSQLTRYWNLPKSQSSAFNYDTTGALEDWMRDKLGLPALVIELTTRSGDEFSRNQNAMWAMLE